jgi:hypothetical protein
LGGSTGPSGNTGKATVNAGGNTLEDKQRALSDFYAQIAEEGVEISGDVESKARQALKGSNFEPSRQITIAQGEGGGGLGEGGGGGIGGRGGPGGLEGAGGGRGGREGLPGKGEGGELREQQQPQLAQQGRQAPEGPAPEVDLGGGDLPGNDRLA